jgi:hypothetical protein
VSPRFGTTADRDFRLGCATAGIQSNESTALASLPGVSQGRASSDASTIQGRTARTTSAAEA